MKFLEDKLEALDTYFAPKKESEKWLMIFGVALVIGYIAYTYFLPYAEDRYKTTENAKKSLQSRIIANNTYLNSITVSGDREYYVKKYDRDIESKKKKIITVTKNIAFIDQNLAKLSDLLFNEKTWSKFLNSITIKAEEQNIDINYIHNAYVDTKGSFGHVLEIAVGCQGNYVDLVKFVNEIEQNTLVTDIYGTKFVPQKDSDMISADINISVWGINY